MIPGLDAISLRLNNPYSIGSVFLFNEGDVLLDGADPILQKSPNDRYYTVEASDDIWTIADKAYGDSKLYWIISKANNLDNAFKLETGTTLYIPDLVTFQLVNQ